MWYNVKEVPFCSDVEAGGETYFRRSGGCPPDMLDSLMTQELLHQPRLATSSQTPSTEQAGLRIKSKQGRAIMFWYIVGPAICNVT